MFSSKLIAADEKFWLASRANKARQILQNPRSTSIDFKVNHVKEVHCNMSLLIAPKTNQPRDTIVCLLHKQNQFYQISTTGHIFEQIKFQKTFDREKDKPTLSFFLLPVRANCHAFQ